MTCAHCMKLAAQLRELEESIGAMSGAEDPIRRRYRLTPLEAKLVCRLYGAAGRTVQTWALNDLWDDPDASTDSIKVHVYRIRKALGREAITTDPTGYSLSPLGRARVYQALHPREAA